MGSVIINEWQVQADPATTPAGDGRTAPAPTATVTPHDVANIVRRLDDRRLRVQAH